MLSARLDARFAEPVYNAGVVLAECGSNTQAAAFFRQAAQLDAAGTRALEYQSQIFCRQQRWSDALTTLDEARRRAPGEPRILTALALLEIGRTNLAPAISRLQEALAQDARYAPAIYNLAVVNHRWLKNDSQAAQLFKDYVRLAPEGPFAAHARQALQEIAKASSAIAPPKTSAAMSAARPPAPGAKQDLPAPADTPAEPRAESYDELLGTARTLQQQNRPDEAVYTYLRAARAAERADKLSARDRAVREADKLAAKSARAHYDLSLYWRERAEADEAMTHLKQAVALSNSWFEANLTLAQLAVEKKEFDTAVVSLKQALQLEPDWPEPLWMLAQLYDQHLSLTNQAIQAYERFVGRFAADGRMAEAQARLKTLRGGALKP